MNNEINLQCFHCKTSKLFKELNILKLDGIVQLNTLLLMYKINHNNVLPNLQMFMCVNEVHGYNTRSANNVFLTSCRTNYRLFSLKYIGAKLWNQLPESLKGSISKNLFKQKLKRLLMQHY